MKRNASFYADAILPPTIDSAGHRHEGHDEIVAFAGFLGNLNLGVAYSQAPRTRNVFTRIS
jgi:hypothetical protein